MKVEHVEKPVSKGRAEELSGGRWPLDKGNADADNRPNSCGLKPGRIPDNHRSPVVANENRIVLAEVVEQLAQVADEMFDSVRLDLIGYRRISVATKGWRNNVIASVYQRRNLVAPRISDLGKSVHQQDRWIGRIAGVDDMQADIVERNVGRGEPCQEATWVLSLSSTSQVRLSLAQR